MLQVMVYLKKKIEDDLDADNDVTGYGIFKKKKN